MTLFSDFAVAIPFISTILLAALTILPVFNSGLWWVRAAEFPRLQLICWASVNSLVIIAVMPSMDILLLVLFANLAVLAYQASWIYPFFPYYPTEVDASRGLDPESAISILSSNVLMPNPNKQALLDIIQRTDPDIVITLESNSAWQSALDRLETRYPHTIKAPLDNLYGMLVYSKLPFETKHLKYLIMDDIPSAHCVVKLRSGKTLNLHVLHPMPPSPTENESSAERDVELIVVGKRIAQHDEPTIVAGDLNDVAWSKTTKLFKHVSGLKDPRIGRGFFNTFHARYPFLRWPLDHIFHSSHFTLLGLKKIYLKGSDHFSLLTKLQLENIDATDKPDTDEDDRELKEQRLDEVPARVSAVPDLNAES